MEWGGVSFGRLALEAEKYGIDFAVREAVLGDIRGKAQRSSITHGVEGVVCAVIVDRPKLDWRHGSIEQKKASRSIVGYIP